MYKVAPVWSCNKLLNFCRGFSLKALHFATHSCRSYKVLSKPVCCILNGIIMLHCSNFESFFPRHFFLGETTTLKYTEQHELGHIAFHDTYIERNNCITTLKYIVNYTMACNNMTRIFMRSFTCKRIAIHRILEIGWNLSNFWHLIIEVIVYIIHNFSPIISLKPLFYCCCVDCANVYHANNAVCNFAL